MRLFISFIILTMLFSACVSETLPKNEKLPIIGFKDFDEQGDTIYHSIPDFSFIDQDSNVITNKTLEGKVYLADWFFIHCPSICPKVKAQMMRIYEKYEGDENVVLMSHTLDPRNDTIPALKAYANKLDVKSNKWHFLTGEHDMLYSMADDCYVIAKVDDDAPGGFDHSGEIILIDENRHIRSHANGTDPKAVDQLLLDIEKLLNEKK